MSDPADDLTKDLRTIRVCWPEMLEPRKAGAQEIRAGDPARPPAPAHTLSVRRETDACLTSWARLVTEERDLRTTLKAGDVPSVAGLLIIHADWLAHHEASDAVCGEVGKWAAKCKDIVENNSTRRYQVGHCPEMTCDDEGAELGACPGNLWALIRQTDTMLPKAIVCDADEAHRWDPHAWSALGRRIVPLDPAGVRSLIRKIA